MKFKFSLFVISILLFGCDLLTPNTESKSDVSNPVITPTGSAFTEDTSVTITVETEGASIRYTTDGTDPTATTGTVYSAPFVITESLTVKAIAYKSGLNPSEVVSKAYTITKTVSSPTFSVTDDLLDTTTSVDILTTTTGATIYYTVDGTTPSTTNKAGSGAGSVTISVSDDVVIKAIAVLDGWNSSLVTTKQYSFTGTVANPTFSLETGYITEAKDIAIETATSGATIYYTINGDTPTESSTVYTGVISVSATTTIKAFAVKTDWTSSAVSEVTYTFTGVVATPTFDNDSDFLTTETDIVLSTTTPGATIYYTINGNTPTTSSTAYTGAISLSETTTLKAIAVLANWATSSIAEKTYTFTSAYYPSNGATGTYIDGALSITFDSAPTLNTDGYIAIYDSSDTLVDTINFTDESQVMDYTINVNNQLVRIVDNKIYITPHYGLLDYGTAYYVIIPSASITGTLGGSAFTGVTTGDWGFTTKSAPTLDATNITVDSSETSSADFRSIQGAFDAMDNLSGDITINLASGTYYELIRYTGSKNVTIEGPSNDRGDNCVITYINYNGYNGSSTTRSAFYFGGGDLTLKNVTLQNSFDRSLDTGNVQAEALYFNSANGKIVAYNSSFKSYQDTLLLKGKAWFYDCYAEGDVDFIWGYADVALFEECDLVSLYDSNRGSTASSAVFVARTGDTSASIVPKGYVLLNSTLTIEDNITQFLGRSASGATSTIDFYDQVAVINSVITGDLDSSIWEASDYYSYEGVGSHIGWKDYGNTLDGSAVDTSSRLANTASMDSNTYTMEYSGRNAILNRVYNQTDSSYEYATDLWDLGDFETEFSATTDLSDSNDYGSLPVTISWDFTTSVPIFYSSTGVVVTTIQSTTGSVSSDTSGYTLDVDATSGKLAQRIANGDAQFNVGTIVSIPVENGYKVTVEVESTNYTLDGIAATANTTVYTYSGSATSIDLVATASTYINVISITTPSTSTGDTETGTGSPEITDAFNGWASYGAPTNVGGSAADSSHTYTVTTKSELLAALNNQSTTAKVIYVDGMIDLCVDSSGNSIDGAYFVENTTLTNSYVVDETTTDIDEDGDIDVYDAYMIAYSKVVYDQNDASMADIDADLDSDQGKLLNAQKANIMVRVGSNTTLLGVGSDSGFKNGTFNISSMDNIVIRNLIFEDAYDYFPEWDPDEGNYNSEWDNLVINDTTHVWVDHCTFNDGDRHGAYVSLTSDNGDVDDWVTHDGLIDIKNGSNYVTLSWNIIEDHNKTMLFGSSDSSTTDTDKLKVTLHHNYFRNVVQRLPRVRFGSVHLYNNYYDTISLYSIGVGDNSRIYSENNYFYSTGTSIGSYDDSSNQGYIWDTGSTNVDSNKLDTLTLVGWDPSDYYTYTAETAEEAKTSTIAGAGVGQF